MSKCAELCDVPIGADEGIHSIEDIQKHYDAGAAMGGSLKLIKLGSSGSYGRRKINAVIVNVS